MTNGDIVDRHAIFMSRMSLARWRSRRWLIPRGIEAEDLESIAYMALWKAATKFKPPVDRFDSYALKWIDYEIIKAIKRFDRMPARNADLSGYPDPDRSDDAEPQSLPISALSWLSRVERVVIVRKYGLSGATPMSSSEIADMIGCSIYVTSIIHNRAIGKLKDFMKL